MFENVLIGVDGRGGGQDAIALAEQLAAPRARRTLAHIYGAGLLPGRATTLLLAGELELTTELLEQARREAGLDAKLLPYAEQSVGRGLQRLARSRHADLTVVGRTQRGLFGRAFGTDDTSRALNGSPAAIAIAPDGYRRDTPALSRIGVGYDGSPESDLAITTARALATRHPGTTITGLTVGSLEWMPYGERSPRWPDAVRWLLDPEHPRRAGMDDIGAEVTYGEVKAELERLSEQVDLLIVGSRSNGPVSRIFNGSTSNHLARRSHCPVLILPRSAGSPSLTEAVRTEIPSAAWTARR